MANCFLGINTGVVVLLVVVTIITIPPLLRWKYVFLTSCISRCSLFNAGESDGAFLLAFKIRSCFWLLVRFPFVYYGDKGVVTEFESMTLWTLHVLKRFSILVNMDTVLRFHFPIMYAKFISMLLKVRGNASCRFPFSHSRLLVGFDELVFGSFGS